MPRAAITAVAHYVPEHILTNELLEQFVDTSDEWITQRTGIKERRILVERDRATTDMAAEAVKQLFEQRKDLKPEDIELVIFCSVTPDHVFPASANILTDKLGMKNAWGYDLNAACSAFLYGLYTGSRFIESGACRRVVVVGADRMSAIINYRDRTTCVIFGDGAGAVLLEPSPDDELGILDAVMAADGSGRHHLFQKAGGSLYPPTIETVLNDMHYVYQEGRQVFTQAVKQITDVVQKVMRRNNLQSEDVSWFVCHQANRRIIEAVARSLSFPSEKVYINIDRYGNTTNGTIPICLSELRPRLQKGDRLILATFGGGFTWGAVYLRWAI